MTENTNRVLSWEIQYLTSTRVYFLHVSYFDREQKENIFLGNLISYTNTDTPRNGSTCIHMDLYLLLALIAYAQTEVFLGKLDTDSSTLIKHNN